MKKIILLLFLQAYCAEVSNLRTIAKKTIFKHILYYDTAELCNALSDDDIDELYDAGPKFPIVMPYSYEQLSHIQFKGKDLDPEHEQYTIQDCTLNFELGSWENHSLNIGLTSYVQLNENNKVILDTKEMKPWCDIDISCAALHQNRDCIALGDRFGHLHLYKNLHRLKESYCLDLFGQALQVGFDSTGQYLIAKGIGSDKYHFLIANLLHPTKYVIIKDETSIPPQTNELKDMNVYITEDPITFETPLPIPRFLLNSYTPTQKICLIKALYAMRLTYCPTSLEKMYLLHGTIQTCARHNIDKEIISLLQSQLNWVQENYRQQTKQLGSDQSCTVI